PHEQDGAGEGALARAGFTDQPQGLTAAHLKAHVVQGGHGVLTMAEALGEVPHPEHVVCHDASSSTAGTSSKSLSAGMTASGERTGTDGRGMLSSSALVYGCCGSSRIRCADPYSTMRP